MSFNGLLVQGACQPSTILGSLVHILIHQFRVLAYDVVCGVAIAKELEYEIHGDTHTSNSRPAVAHSRLNFDAIKQNNLMIEATA